MSAAPPRWLSYHVHLTCEVDPFLTDDVAPLAATWLAEGRVRRFFFIRYGEGGPHVRLRFRAPDDARPVLGDALRRAAIRRDHDARVLDAPYDRADAYFGETMDSVHAELLNEQTSALALDVIRQTDLGSFERAAAFLGLTHALAAAAEDAPDAILADARRFAADACAAYDPDASTPTTDEVAAWAAVAERARPAVARAFADRPAFLRTAALLRRVRQRPSPTPFVGTHGLHLLCNKLGYGLRAEAAFTQALCSLPALS